jgi:site-specific DNA recombinase
MLPKSKPSSAFRVAFYIRVSTEEQAENPEGSIRNQEHRLRAALDYKNSLGRFGDLKGVYTDAGISAKDMKRPELQELLRSIRNKEIDLVMVTELSRLSRNTRDFIQMWDMMREHGCRFQSLREDFDTTNAAGELVLFQLMNLAQFERRQVSERVEANFQVRAARGLHNGGSVPVGYVRHPENRGHFAIDEEMAKLVRKAFERFLKEGTLRKATLFLNDKGYRLRIERDGGKFKRSGLFTMDNLQAILRNKAYIGVRVYKVKGELKEAKAAWPAIVNEKIFYQAGALLTKNRSSLKPLGQRRKLPYLLSGITSCLTCASAMSGKSATGNGGKVGYYEHVWATKRDSGLTKKMFKCDPHRIPSKVIEPLVWAEFSKFMNDPNFVKEIFKRAQALQKSNPGAKEADRIKAKLSGINSQTEALTERLSELPKGVPATPIYKQMEKLEGLRSEFAEMLEKMTASGASGAVKVAQWETFDQFSKLYRAMLIQGLDSDQKRTVLQKFIRKVEVGTDSLKIHFMVDENHYRDELAHGKRELARFITLDGGMR